MIFDVALCVGATNRGARAIEARIYAAVVVAGFCAGAVLGALTFTASTRDQRIAEVTFGARANWTRFVFPICAVITFSITSARVGYTHISWRRGVASVERMTIVTLGTLTDGFMVGHLTFRSGAAGVLTRVTALVVDAGLVTGAFAVGDTLRVAASDSVALVVFGTLADWSMVHRFTSSVLTASSRARVLTPVLYTNLFGGTFRVGDTFWAATSKGVTDVRTNTTAYGLTPLYATVCVLPTWRWRARRLRVVAAQCERVTEVVLGATTDGAMCLNIAFSADSANSAETRILTLQIDAGLTKCTFAVVRAFSASAAG